jgi:hypothetical protein
MEQEARARAREKEKERGRKDSSGQQVGVSSVLAGRPAWECPGSAWRHQRNAASRPVLQCCRRLRPSSVWRAPPSARAAQFNGGGGNFSPYSKPVGLRWPSGHSS